MAEGESHQSEQAPEVDASPASVELPVAASGFWGAYQQLMYGLSLPERTLRSTTALVGGTLHEAGQLLVPQAFRSSRSYCVMIQQSLDLLLTHVGGVSRTAAADANANAGAATSDAPPAQATMARKAVGSFLDLAGVATLHLSPLVVLAVVSDLAYGSQRYLQELSEELKREGVIDERSTIYHATDLLTAVSEASRLTSGVFDAPPLSVEGMRETIAQTAQAVRQLDPSRIIPQAELEQIWNSIQSIAREEKVSPFEVSSSLALYTLNQVGTVGRGALSSVQLAGNLFDRHIFEHYRGGLRTIRSQGLYGMLAITYRPYIDAVWSNFSSSRTTWTEDLLSGRWLGKAWDKVSDLWDREK